MVVLGRAITLSPLGRLVGNSLGSESSLLEAWSHTTSQWKPSYFHRDGAGAPTSVDEPSYLSSKNSVMRRACDLVSKTRARIVQTESFNGFESKRITDISHEDLEELLATIKIPELLKDMIRMKVHFQFSNQQVASFFGMSESRTSQYIGYWSHHILEVMKERSIKSGINWVKNIKPRAIPQCMNKNKNKSKDLSLAH